MDREAQRATVCGVITSRTDRATNMSTKWTCDDFPGGPAAGTLLSLPRTWVHYLARRLRSLELLGMAKKHQNPAKTDI